MTDEAWRAYLKELSEDCCVLRDALIEDGVDLKALADFKVGGCAALHAIVNTNADQWMNCAQFQNERDFNMRSSLVKMVAAYVADAYAVRREMSPRSKRLMASMGVKAFEALRDMS